MKKINDMQKIVLLGPPGSFSDEAADERRVLSILRVPRVLSKHYVGSFEAIFKNLKPGVFGLLPVKNKILGDIKESVKLMEKYKPKEIFRFRLPVKFAIAAKNKIKLEDVRTIYCSNIARAQCLGFILEKLPAAIFLGSFDSTSTAFTKVVQLKGLRAKQCAGIGSVFGAKMYKLHVLAKNIQDDKKDWTEFVVITRESAKSAK